MHDVEIRLGPGTGVEPGSLALAAAVEERGVGAVTVRRLDVTGDGLAPAVEAADAVVVGHDPPTADGVELTGAIHEADPLVPVCLRAVGGDESVAGAALTAGVSAYLPAATTTPGDLADRQAPVGWWRGQPPLPGNATSLVTVQTAARGAEPPLESNATRSSCGV
jgi:hypothetical protein